MAIDKGSETKTVSTEERTWRVNIETPKGAVPVVTVFRETLQTSNEETVKVGNSVVVRNLADIVTQKYDINGKSYTTGEIAQVISAIADIWAEEDENED